MERLVQFGTFRFDTETGRLWNGGGEIRLTPKAAAVLNVLVAQPGEPVSKEDLFASAWAGTAVSDDALTATIVELRRALEDDAKHPRYIETRHRRGYRFAASVLPADHRAAGETRESARSPAPHDRTESVLEGAAIAVLPFADMSPGHDHAYLCEGLAEELINALTHVDGLRVVARTASFQFRQIGADVQAIGRQLGVSALLEGSVRKSGDRLRVTVQLIDTATGFHRWSERFDRAFDDVFVIQDEIAERVVLLLRGAVLSPREQNAIRRTPANTEAYEYYLRGRQFLPRQTREGLTTSVRMFERAIAIDDTYAPAHAGLAMAHAALYEWFGSNDHDKAAAERASERGLALAPTLADAHVARGCALTLSRRYADAARAFETAIALNPHFFEACYYYARSSFAGGGIARSGELFQKAADLRHEDFQSALLAGQSLDMLERHGEAQAIRREGLRRAERALALNPADARALSLGAANWLDDGQPARALEWCDRALALHPEDMSTLINGACLRARLGLKDGALDLLEKAFAHSWGQRDWIENDRDYDSLRDDPRFQMLLARLK